MKFRASPGQRKCHRAKLIGPNGEVSPLCAKTPRVINMNVGSVETWTTTDDQVTCPKCIAILDNSAKGGAR